MLATACSISQLATTTPDLYMPRKLCVCTRECLQGQHGHYSGLKLAILGSFKRRLKLWKKVISANSEVFGSYKEQDNKYTKDPEEEDVGESLCATI